MTLKLTLDNHPQKLGQLLYKEEMIRLVPTEFIYINFFFLNNY